MHISNFLPVLFGSLVALVAVPPAEAGEGLEQGLRAWAGESPGQAVAAWRPLAEGGDLQAQLYLAYAYRRGRGVARDHAWAAHWYRRAAEQGSADAQYQLGLMYELGLGMPADQGEADYWYGRAVAQGYCPGELSAGGRLGD